MIRNLDNLRRDAIDVGYFHHATLASFSFLNCEIGQAFVIFNFRPCPRSCERHEGRRPALAQIEGVCSALREKGWYTDVAEVDDDSTGILVYVNGEDR